jgi:hypothetical protein
MARVVSSILTKRTVCWVRWVMVTVARSTTKTIVEIFGRCTGAFGFRCHGCTIPVHLISYMIPSGGISCTRHFGIQFKFKRNSV